MDAASPAPRRSPVASVMIIDFPHKSASRAARSNDAERDQPARLRARLRGPKTVAAACCTVHGVGGEIGDESEASKRAELNAWTKTLTVDPEITQARSADCQPVDRVGRFAILRVLGQGGMGRVLVGYDEQLDRRVAVKLLRWPGQSNTADARLMREAQALARLSHPNVVQVHEAGTHGDAVYMAMELVEGHTLTEWSALEEHDWSSTLDVLLQAGRGLEAAHAAGIVHRDFKPDNVLVGADGRVRVLDFGLARNLDVDVEKRASGDGEAQPPSRVSAGADPVNLLRTPLTNVGAVMGTFAYMAPEQHEGRPCDASADQFAFCVSAFETLFGSLPFDACPIVALALAKASGDVASTPPDSRVPNRVRDALLRGLSPEPAARWPDMTALLAALELARGRRRRWLLPSAAVALGVILLGANALPAGQADAPCASADAPITRVWSDDQRAASELGLDDGGATLSRLDDWAASWSATALESCEDVHVRHLLSASSLDRRGICLGRRLAIFDALTLTLANREIDTGPALIEWLGRLDDPRECLSEAVLVGELEAIPPQLAPQLAELRRTMVRVELGRERRSLPERVRLTQELLAQAEALGWRPLIGEAALLLGSLHTAASDGALARRHLGRAIDIADATHDVEQQIFAWSAMNQVERLVEFDVARARWAWERQAAVIEQIGASPRQRALLLTDLGLTHELAGDEAEAERSLREALVLLEQLDPPAAWQQAAALRNLANLLAYTGRAKEASELLEHARTLELGSSDDARAGQRAPSTTASRLDEGIALIQGGDPSAAASHLTDTLEAAVRDYGPRSEVVARVHVALAAAYSMLDRKEELRVHAELADRISLEALGPLHPLRADVLSAVGESALQGGRLADAVRAFEAALRLARRIKSADSIAVAQAEFNLADVLHQDGQHERADRLMTHALPLLERALGAEHPLHQEASELASSIRAAMTSD